MPTREQWKKVVSDWDAYAPFLTDDQIANRAAIEHWANGGMLKSSSGQEWERERFFFDAAPEEYVIIPKKPEYIPFMECSPDWVGERVRDKRSGSVALIAKWCADTGQVWIFGISEVYGSLELFLEYDRLTNGEWKPFGEADR